jgi:hypothetical protein
MGMDEKGKEPIVKINVLSSRFDVKKEDWRNLLVLLAIGLMLRLYAFSQIYMISNDGAFQYIPVAKLFYQGAYLEALQQPQLPLYPFLISILSHVTGNFEVSGQLISIMFSLLAIFPLYLIGKSLFGPRPAFWTTMLYLTNPLMLHCSVDVLKEGLLIFLFFSSVYYSLRFLQEGSGRWLIWIVVFSAAGALVSMIALVVLVALGVWLGYGALRGRVKEKVLAYRYLWVVVAIAGITVIFFFIPGIINWEFWITKKPYKVIEGFFYRWFVAEWPGLAQIGERLLYIVDRFIEKTYYVPLPFAVFGLVWKVKTREFSAEERYLALLIGVLIVIFFPNLYASGRYHLPAIFLLYLLAGFGFAKVLELIGRRFTKYRRLAPVILMSILFGSMVSFSLQPQRLDKVGYKEVGLWLRKQTLTPLIMTDDPRVAYYAGGEYIMITPGATPEEVVKKGIAERADYLVIEERRTEGSGAFAPFEKKGVLKLILRHPDGNKRRTIYVYTMKKAITPSQKAL